MATSKNKIKYEQAGQFRKFLESRGVKCRDGKGQWQLFQVEVPGVYGWKTFCFNANQVVSGPSELDDYAIIFNSPVEDFMKDAIEIVEVEKLSKHDSDLLDDFAISALQGVIASEKEMHFIHLESSAKSIKPVQVLARISYEIGLAMLVERAKHQTK